MYNIFLENSLDVDFKALKVLTLQGDEPIELGIEIVSLPPNRILVFSGLINPSMVFDKMSPFQKGLESFRIQIKGDVLEEAIVKNYAGGTTFCIDAIITLGGVDKIFNVKLGGLTVDDFVIEGEKRIVILRQNYLVGDDSLIRFEKNSSDYMSYFNE